MTAVNEEPCNSVWRVRYVSGNLFCASMLSILSRLIR